MTVLISGGDSFTYGSELSSQEHAWSNLLAKKLGMNICNTAVAGMANGGIRRNVMNAINKYKDLDLFVAVMWSFPNRYEFRFAYDTGNTNSPWYSINPWIYLDVDIGEHFHQKDSKVLRQNIAHRENAEDRGINSFARSFVKNVADTEYWELYTSWCEIVMLQNYLVKHNIRYVFMHVDDSLFNVNSTMDQSLRTLREDIDMTKWGADIGMYNWAKQTKQPFYTTHPKEIAHAEWINTLYIQKGP